MKFKVYLAGSVYSEPEDISWKTNLMKIIINDYKCDDFTFYDPNPAFENKLDKENDIRFHVVPKDKKIISQCDLLVAYVQKASFGTAMEIGYAYDKSTIQVITINPNQKFASDIWLNHHSHKMTFSVERCAEELIWISKAMLVYNK